MKKSYVKPQVYFESFQLSANIAAGCTPDFKVNYNVESCAWSDGVETIFVSSECSLKGNELEDAGKICYNIPFANSKFFSS